MSAGDATTRHVGTSSSGAQKVELGTAQNARGKAAWWFPLRLPVVRSSSPVIFQRAPKTRNLRSARTSILPSDNHVSLPNPSISTWLHAILPASRLFARLTLWHPWPGPALPLPWRRCVAAAVNVCRRHRRRRRRRRRRWSLLIYRLRRVCVCVCLCLCRCRCRCRCLRHLWHSTCLHLASMGGLG
jgi:hypothetical protein